jgi:transcription antitermination factor NusG
VSFGGKPTPVDDAIITFVRSRVRPDGFVVIGEQFDTGDQVLVKDGLLKSFIGVFEREMKGSDRVMILLTAIGYQAHVLIDRDLLKKLT